MAQRSEITWHGDEVQQAIREAVAQGLALAAEHLVQVSRELCPHEEGTLERSGTASVDEAELRAAVAYDTPYAVRQHEDLTLNHKRKGQAKYLEQPAGTEAGTMRDKVATEIRRALR